MHNALTIRTAQFSLKNLDCTNIHVHYLPPASNLIPLFDPKPMQHLSQLLSSYLLGLKVSIFTAERHFDMYNLNCRFGNNCSSCNGYEDPWRTITSKMLHWRSIPSAFWLDWCSVELDLRSSEHPWGVYYVSYVLDQCCAITVRQDNWHDNGLPWILMESFQLWTWEVMTWCIII